MSTSRALRALAEMMVDLEALMRAADARGDQFDAMEFESLREHVQDCRSVMLRRQLDLLGYGRKRKDEAA